MYKVRPNRDTAISARGPHEMTSNIDAEASCVITRPAPMVVVEETKRRLGTLPGRLSWVAMSAIVAFATAVAGSRATVAAEPPASASSYSPSDQASGSTVAPQPESAPIMLSDQQRQVSAIAAKNGDRDFL